MPGPTELQITYTHAPRFRSTEAAALEYLEDHGYVIIANALTKTETSTAMDKLWSYLESLETGIDRSGPDTWGDTRWPTAVHGGILPCHGIGQSEAQWYIRSIPAVKAAFAAVWGPEDSLVSFDGVSIWRPWSRKPEWHERRTLNHHRLHSIETITDEFIDFLGVVTIGQDIKQSLVGNEVEAWEDLLLLFEILVESLLTKIDLRDELFEDLVTAFGVGGVDDAGIVASITHEALPFRIHLFEAFGVLRELSTDILRVQEDGLQTHPVLLHFNPKDEHVIDRLEGLLPLEEVFLELFGVLGSIHGHQVHRLKVDVFNDFFEGTSVEHLSFSVLFEVEDSGVVPSLDDDVELLLNTSFFLGTFDELVNIL